MSFQDFELINIDGVNYCKCKKCGAVLSTGIIGLSQHWADCSGYNFYRDIMATAKNNTLDINTVEKIIEKHKTLTHGR